MEGHRSPPKTPPAKSQPNTPPPAPKKRKRPKKAPEMAWIKTSRKCTIVTEGTIADDLMSDDYEQKIGQLVRQPTRPVLTDLTESMIAEDMMSDDYEQNI